MALLVALTTPVQKAQADGSGTLGNNYAQDFIGSTGILTNSIGTVTSSSTSLPFSYIPDSATIDRAYLYVTQELYGATAADTDFSVNGTAYTGVVIGTESALTAGASSISVVRTDVTPEFVAMVNGTYAVSGIGFAAASREVIGVALIVVFRDSASASEESRVVINDGAMISCEATGDDFATSLSGFNIDKEVVRSWFILSGGHGESATTDNAVTLNGIQTLVPDFYSDGNGGYLDMRTPARTQWLVSAGNTQFDVAQVGGDDCVVNAFAAMSVTERINPVACTGTEEPARVDWDGYHIVPNSDTSASSTFGFTAGKVDVEFTTEITGATWRSIPTFGIPFVGYYPANQGDHWQEGTGGRFQNYSYNPAGSWGQGYHLHAEATRTGTGVLTFSTTFETDVDEVHFSVLDIDDNDVMQITALNDAGVDVEPVLSAGNAAPSFTLFSDPGTNTYTATGNGTSNGKRDTLGTVNVEFATAVKTITVTVTNTTDSVIGTALTDIFFCSETYGAGTLPNCDPGDGTEGVILASTGDQIGTSTRLSEVHIVNLETGVTNLLFDKDDTDISPIPITQGINSVAVDEVNNRVFFVHESTGATENTLYVYEGDTGKYRVLVPDLTAAPLNIQRGNYGFASAAATFYDGYLFLAIEDVQYPVPGGFFPYTFARDQLYRISFDGAGDPVEAKMIWAGTAQYGDIVIRDGVVYTTSLHEKVIQFDLLKGGTEIVHRNSPDYKIGQSSLSHDGSIWSVWDNIKEYDSETKQMIGTEIPLTGDWNSKNVTDATACVNPFSSLPVTIDTFSTHLRDERLLFRWATASETFTAGFKLWTVNGDDWRQIGKPLIPSKASESFAGSKYRYQSRIKPSEQGVEFVGISSIDIDGAEHFFGPFKVETLYGKNRIAKRIPWDDVRTQQNVWYKKNGYRLSGTQWHKQPTSSDAAADHAQFAYTLYTERAGLHRITAKELKSAGLDLNRVKTDKIAITHLGEPVPRFVRGGQEFTDSSWIDFVADDLSTDDALHTGRNAYRIEVNPSLVIEAGRLPPPASAVDATYRHTEKIEIDRQYSFTSADPDPWYDTRILAYDAPVAHTVAVKTSRVVPNIPAELSVTLNAVTAWPGSTQDHHVRLYFNGTQVADELEDGQLLWTISTLIDPSLIVEGDNTVEIEVVGDTDYQFDLVHFERLNLTYTREKSPIDGSLTFRDQATAHRVKGADPQSQFYARTADSILKLQKHIDAQGDILISGAGEDADYFAVEPRRLLVPTLDIRPLPSDLTSTPADFLIVAHPIFMTALDRYVSAKTAEGLTVAVINVEDVYAQFGHGLNTPTALEKFFNAATAEFEYRHVLLVGAASADPTNIGGENSINLIPTRYTPTQLIAFTPNDGALVDFDKDGRPDRSIGRWPVRTVNELNNVIDKSLRASVLTGHRNSVLGISDASAPGTNFKAQVLRILDQFTNSGFEPTVPVHLDDLSATEVRTEIIDTINEGVGVTLFAGHGSPSAWSYQNLLTASDLEQLTNASEPTLAMPLACYTTYFVSPATDTLGQSLLLSPDGASAIHGAATLSYMHHNEAMITEITRLMLDEHETIGEAIRRAKSSLGTQFLDVIINWTLLGDPTLRLRQQL